MLTIVEMKAEMQQVLTRLGGIKSQCNAENREMTDQEKETSEKLLDRYEVLEQDVAREERLAAAHDRSAPSADPNAAKDVKIGSAGDARGSGLTDGYKTDADKFPSLGAQLRAVAMADSGGHVDPRLNLVNRAYGLEEGSPSEGGWLIQQEFVTEVMKRTYETGKLAKYCTKFTIGEGKNGLKINAIDESSRATGSRWGGIQAYWIAEASAKTKSKPKFCQIELDLKKLIGLCYATDEVLEDAAVLETLIKQGFAEEFGFMMDDAIIRGTGAGMPRGILECDSKYCPGRETEGTITYSDILLMWAHLWTGSKSKAVWFVTADIWPTLYAMRVNCTSSCYPVYLPPNQLAGEQYSTLMGRPIVELEQCSAIGTTGDILLLDLSQYLLIDKGGIKGDRSIHVRFIYDESVFRFVYRADGDCGWCSYLTPYKGSKYKSPFVCLTTATR